jgi:hypothetical protein
MADYVINCQANSLLEKKRELGGSIGASAKRFFCADFTRGQMDSLVQAQRESESIKFAGICIVKGYENDVEVVYAFRVQWNGANLVRSAKLNIDIVTELSLPEIPPVPGENVLAFSAPGEITWRQQPTNEYTPDATFVFIDAFTIKKILADPNPNLKIRVRKTSVRSKIKTTPNDDFPGTSTKLSTYIVETVPTFLDKTIAPPLGGLTDTDVLAYDYGYPCPPAWNQSNMTILANRTKNIEGFGIIDRAQVIRVAGDNSITMGVLIDALWQNRKVRNLLKDWTLYSEPKTLKVSEKRGGHTI